MDVQTATEILSGVTYKPGWKFSVDSVYSDTETKAQVLVIRADYRVNNSDRYFAPEYGQEIDVTTYWPVNLSQIEDMDYAHFATLVFSAIMSIETHESREFFSVQGAEFFKPFHPHTSEGQLNFAMTVGDPRMIEMDLVYGQKDQSEPAMLAAVLDSGLIL